MRSPRLSGRPPCHARRPSPRSPRLLAPRSREAWLSSSQSAGRSARFAKSGLVTSWLCISLTRRAAR
eukprot:11955677-Alexandrium_andersonii.AAC.1